MKVTTRSWRLNRIFASQRNKSSPKRGNASIRRRSFYDIKMNTTAKGKDLRSFTRAWNRSVIYSAEDWSRNSCRTVSFALLVEPRPVIGLSASWLESSTALQLSLWKTDYSVLFVCFNIFTITLLLHFCNFTGKIFLGLKKKFIVSKYLRNTKTLFLCLQELISSHFALAFAISLYFFFFFYLWRITCLIIHEMT